jgi:hypothetical protein
MSHLLYTVSYFLFYTCLYLWLLVLQDKAISLIGIMAEKAWETVHGGLCLHLNYSF